MKKQGGSAPTWSVAINWVLWPWSFPGTAGQGQAPPMFSLGLLCLKQSELAATCAGLGESQAKPSCDSNLAAASARPGVH